MKNKLKAFRFTAGLTQEELARKLAVTRQTVIAIEKGYYLPSLHLAYRMAKLFNSTIEEVFQLKEADEKSD